MELPVNNVGAFGCRPLYTWLVGWWLKFNQWFLSLLSAGLSTFSGLVFHTVIFSLMPVDKSVGKRWKESANQQRIKATGVTAEFNGQFCFTGFTRGSQNVKVKTLLAFLQPT